ncbi:MAG: efflux RND transporter periplasmic adaptor subunit, partial [Candidatus Cloacimonetes bacterium]|nr:efflux RND transporter periplasmic adaptor subunit [Candidatus Cloacimonadota bacterium]
MRNENQKNVVAISISQETTQINTIIMTLIVLIAMFLTGCGQKKDDQPANMEAIHREHGVPVVVQEIELTKFVVELEYQTTVHGFLETRVFAGINDQVESINARVGQVVSQNAVIINFPQDNPQANYVQTKAAFELAEQTLRRTQNLFETGGVSQHDLDGAETHFRVAQANYEATQRAVFVKAPISGTITDINVRLMERVTAGQYLFTVSQLNTLHAKIWISPNDINKVSQNASATFRHNGSLIEGRIVNIGLTLNPEQNAFAADIAFENPNRVVRGGLTGTAKIVTYSNDKAISIPRGVVQRDIEGQAFVFVAQDGIAVRRDIEISNRSDLQYEIASGLEVGDLLIVQGLQFV